MLRLPRHEDRHVNSKVLFCALEGANKKSRQKNSISCNRKEPGRCTFTQAASVAPTLAPGIRAGMANANTHRTAASLSERWCAVQSVLPATRLLLRFCLSTSLPHGNTVAEWTEWPRALDWIENRTFSSGRLADEPGTRHTRESAVCQHGDHQNQVRSRSRSTMPFESLLAVYDSPRIAPLAR